MSNSVFETTDLPFAAAMAYTFGYEALTSISHDTSGSRPVTTFRFDAPSCDCELYLTEFKNGQFAISDLLSYVKQHNKILAVLKQMRRDNEYEWNSLSWVRGRG